MPGIRYTYTSPRTGGGGAKFPTQLTFALGAEVHSAYTERFPFGGCMKVFLTGGSGYIGSTVALALKKAGHDVLALVRDEAKGQALKAAGGKLGKGDLANPAGDAGAALGRGAHRPPAGHYFPAG